MSAQKDPIEFYNKDANFNFLANTVEGFPINVKLGKKNGVVENLDIACTETLFQVSKGLVNNTSSRNIDACFQALKNDRKYTTGGASAGYSGNHVLLYNDPANPYRDGVQYTGTDHPNKHINGAPLELKERVMYEALMMKVTQHPNILKWLLDPKNQDKEIVEDTSLAEGRHNDAYWGVGKAIGADGKPIDKRQGNGRNALGRLWKLVQQDLKKEMDAKGQVQVRSGFSPNISSILGVESEQLDQNKAITKDNLQKLQTIDKADLPAQNHQAHVYSPNMGTNPSTNPSIFTTPTKPISVAQQQTPSALPPPPPLPGIASASAAPAVPPPPPLLPRFSRGAESSQPPSFHIAKAPPGSSQNQTSKPAQNPVDSIRSSLSANIPINRADISTTDIEFAYIRNRAPTTLAVQYSNKNLRNDNATQDIMHKIDKIASSGTLQKMDTTSTKNPKFEFKDGEYKVTVPEKFSGEVFVPRLNDKNEIVGHDLLAYKEGKHDPIHSVIDTSDHKICKVEKKLLAECRKTQQEHEQTRQKDHSHEASNFHRAGTRHSVNR